MRKPLLSLVLTAALAAQTGTNAIPNSGGVTFTANAQLVIETVSVKDKSGKPITGLTAKDFTITEDNTPQEIKFFEFQELSTEVLPVPVADNLRVDPVPRLAHSQIAPEAPGDVKYRDRRLIAIYFDLSGMPLPDQLRAFTSAKKFVRTQMTANDLVAIMAFSSGSVQVMEDFTDNRSKLLSTIETLIIGEDENAPEAPNAGAAFGQNDSEFSIFFTDRQLSALQTAVNMLGRLNEKKSLIYFASGLRLNGTNNQAQLNATTNAAVRSGVQIWPVDARGLIAQPPMGNATTSSPGGQGAYTGATINAGNRALQQSHDTMWTLAADTGGKALLDNNDLSQGIVQAQRSTSSYYILGYYTTNTTPDGKLRRVKITLANGTDAVLEYRQSYYAQKVFTKFTSADKERQLEDALLLGDPITELTMAMEIDYFQLNRAEYFVPLTVKLPAGGELTTIDFLGEVKDEFGTTVGNVRDKIDIKVKDPLKRPLQYDTGFTLLPGKYRVKFLARDSVTGRIGTYMMPFVIPNLNRETARIPISSVVLSSQRVDMKDALFTAGKDKGAQAQLASPLVMDGQKLIPSVTRVFSKAKEMFVFFQAYQQVEVAQPLVAFVTFYRDGQKVFETAPSQVVDASPSRLKTMTLRFNFPLNKLDEGEHLCQITVLDAAGKKAAFWQAPVMLVP